MKVLLSLMWTMLFALSCAAQDRTFFRDYRLESVEQPSFRETLSKATLAVYQGKQKCKDKIVEDFFFPVAVWTCEFESHFICTATVINADGTGLYKGITAGHCFDWLPEKSDTHYYVSDSVNPHPVLCKIKILKFSSNDQYDYGVFEFESLRDYPVIHLNHDLKGGPEVGSKVMNANFSLGVVKEVVEGPVVSESVSEIESEDEPDLRRRYFVQIPFGPGASGSAVVDEKSHEIVGLVEAMFRGTQMAAVIIPTGSNFIDFENDDSVGMRPLPRPEVKEEKKEEPIKKLPPTLREELGTLFSREHLKVLFWALVALSAFLFLFRERVRTRIL